MSALNLLTPQELSDELRGAIGVDTLKKWRQEGKGPDFIRAGDKKILYRLADVEEWLEQNRRESL